LGSKSESYCTIKWYFFSVFRSNQLEVCNLVKSDKFALMSVLYIRLYFSAWYLYLVTQT